MSPEQRTLRARLAAAERWSKPGARADQAAKARQGRLAHYERLVDPDGVMDPAERRACAKSAADAQLARARLAKTRQAR